MNWLNHFLVSFNLLFLILNKTASISEMVIFAIVFGLWFDFDHLTRRFILGQKDSGHLRTWVQEPFGIMTIGVGLAIILSLLYQPYSWILVLVPAISHVGLDYLLIHEVSPFSPFYKKKVKLGFIKPFPIPPRFKGRKEISENYITIINIIVLIILLRTYLPN